MKLILLALCAVLCCAEDSGNVYIYRLRILSGSKRRMTLSLDGHQLAYLQNGRFWALKLSPGEHTLSDKDPNNYLKFTVVPGQTTFIRSEWLQNRIVGFNARFSVSDHSTGTGDLRRLKPGDPEQFRNPAVGLIERKDFDPAVLR